MSGTTTTSTPSMQTLMIWGAIVVSVSVSLSFFAALVVSYIRKDDANHTVLVSAIITNMATVVGYWLGSSAGSARKTEQMAAQPPRSNP